jgi:heme/copper-type cytochrome/quinol oxidase subunit 2
MSEIGKSLIFLGVVVIIVGIVLLFSDRLPFNLGKLPGDISIKKENFSFYFPITTSVIISILLSVVFYLFGRFFK